MVEPRKTHCDIEIFRHFPANTIVKGGWGKGRHLSLNERKAPSLIMKGDSHKQFEEPTCVRPPFFFHWVPSQRLWFETVVSPEFKVPHGRGVKYFCFCFPMVGEKHLVHGRTSKNSLWHWNFSSLSTSPSGTDHGWEHSCQKVYCLSMESVKGFSLMEGRYDIGSWCRPNTGVWRWVLLDTEKLPEKK